MSVINKKLDRVALLHEIIRSLTRLEATFDCGELFWKMDEADLNKHPFFSSRHQAAGETRKKADCKSPQSRCEVFKN